MNKIKFLTVAVFVSLISFSLNAQTLTKTATTAAQFLKVNVGPRAIGMGGAFTASANDPSAIYWNPAGIASNFNNEAIFNHIDWIEDVGLDYAAVTSYLSGLGTVGLSVSVLSMDEMVVRTEEQPEGTGEYFDFSGMAFGLSYARMLTDNFSIGFNFKYIREDLWHMSSSAFAVDIGTMYKINILNEFRLGASISNFGTKMKLEGRDVLIPFEVGNAGGNLLNVSPELDAFDLPLVFRVGVAADVIRSSDNMLTLAVDAVHPNDNYEYINTGAEYSWNDILFLRAGYKSLFEEDSEQGLTLGGGLKYLVTGNIYLKVDYAYQDWGRLTDTHYISMGVKF